MSSSPDRLTARGGATRQRLIESARLELLATGGSLEVAKVAHRAEVSPGLLYRYFGAKDGLVAAVVHEFYDRYDKVVFAASRAPDVSWSEGERQRLAREIDFMCDDPMAQVVVGRLLREPSAAQADAERLAGQIELAARNVAAAQRLGEVDGGIDARLVSAAFLGAFRELMAEALSRPTPPDRPALLDTIWKLGRSIIPNS